LRDAQAYLAMPSEWIGEIALAINEVLAGEDLPDRLRDDMEDAVEAIRMGLSSRRVTAEFLDASCHPIDRDAPPSPASARRSVILGP
jgi:hypothetical protein